jgi:hypothetical protein
MTSGGAGGGGTQAIACGEANAGCGVATVTAELASAAACAASVFDCVTAPSSPGLATRIETATLQLVQPPVSGTGPGGATSEQSHCQFQIQPDASAGGAGICDTSAQFQLQFQIHVPGGS